MHSAVLAEFGRSAGRGALAILLLVALGACGVLVPGEDPPARAPTVERIFITTRAPLHRPTPRFGAARADPVSYSRIDVGVPATHRPGRIEWPGASGRGDRIVLSEHRRFDGPRDFLAGLDRSADPSEPVLIFVHGFNTSTLEGVLRFAQIKTDFQQTAPSVLFAWPSADDPRAYAYDRDSVLFARDDLVDVIAGIARHTNRDIAILAHSMGALLSMEALRQLALAGDTGVLGRVVWVTLVAPDIDPDVFRAQATAIGTLPREFYILSTRQDRALSLSSFLTGGRGRIGTIVSPEQVSGLDVTVLDLSGFAGGGGTNHGLGFSSPEAIRALIALSDGTAPPKDRQPEIVPLTP